MTTPQTATRVFLSFPAVTDPTRHAEYNAWHQLDHQPENLALPGVLHGARWVRTPACRAHGEVRLEPLQDSDYLAMYWFVEPAAESILEWRGLGELTRQQGRRPDLAWTTRPVMGMFRPIRGHLAPQVRISLAALPFRVHTGVYVEVSRVRPGDAVAAQSWFEDQEDAHIPGLLAIPGAVGAWTFSDVEVTVAGEHGERLPLTDLRVTLVYLESDPVDYAAALAGADRRAGEAASGGIATTLFRGPLATVQPWRWNWFSVDLLT